MKHFSLKFLNMTAVEVKRASDEIISGSNVFFFVNVRITSEPSLFFFLL